MPTTPTDTLLMDKAGFLKNYSMQGLSVTCIAKTFQLPNRVLDGVLYNVRGDYALCLSLNGHLDFYDLNEWVLPLRDVLQLTDEECIHIARLAHQMPNAKFEVIRRDKRLIHVEFKNHVGITYHISINEYGAVNANMHFSKIGSEPSKSYKHNIGEITMSSRLPLPYVAICDYFRQQSILIPYREYTVEQIISMGWAVTDRKEAE